MLTGPGWAGYKLSRVSRAKSPLSSNRKACAHGVTRIAENNDESLAQDPMSSPEVLLASPV
ncbi:hypothetical protein BABINDRAFT_159005, partial [Babjeviella inositovora NRRL Y-12698]